MNKNTKSWHEPWLPVNETTYVLNTARGAIVKTWLTSYDKKKEQVTSGNLETIWLFGEHWDKKSGEFVSIDIASKKSKDPKGKASKKDKKKSDKKGKSL